MDESYCPTTAEPGELVVDSTEIELVRQGLGDLHIRITGCDAAPALDLALLTLAHDDEAGTPVADVDPVVAELRRRFAARCGGWTPFLGKNRRMTSQFGAYPQTKSMGYWDPKAYTPQEPLFAGDLGTGVRVGLLDTRIFDHPDLAGLAVETPGDTKFDTPADGERFHVEEGHGVFAAGLILQEAPKATLVARAALGPDGKGSAWDVVKKLGEFLADEHRVSHLVLASGCRTHDGKAPLILVRAIERLSPHVLVIAAAGNHGEVVGMSPDVQITSNSPTWPAALPGVTAVGVTAAAYTPVLPWVGCTVDRTAPDTFLSTYLKAQDVLMHEEGVPDDFCDGYATWRGTSCGAAFVGGAVAAGMTGGKTAHEALRELHPHGVPQFAWQYPGTP